MSIFANTTDLLVTGGMLVVGTAVVVPPFLYLAAPTLTETGTSRVGIKLLKRAYRSLVPRSHPAEAYPEVEPSADTEVHDV